MNRGHSALAIGLLAIWLVGAAPVAADCEPAAPLEQVLPKADVAFVGTVTTFEGSVATFAVREVWAGDVADSVSVRGFFEVLGGRAGLQVGGGAPVGEDDRLWTVGETYLVVPWIDGAILRDSICTATTAWSPDLEPLRPADARILGAEEPEATPIPPALILLGTVALVVLAASALAFRRR